MASSFSPRKRYNETIMTMVMTDNGLLIPGRHIWTREKYERATELGLLGPDDRVELIEGEIVQKMPQNSPHSTAVSLAQDALRLAFPTGHVVRSQLPLSIGGLSQPEPDIAVVVGSVRDYRNRQPDAEDAVLIVEVSDSTLLPDQTTKAALYARAGIEEYWIVNLPDGILEVHRRPAPQDGAPLGHAYQEITRLAQTESVAPLAAPASFIAVADLLP